MSKPTSPRFPTLTPELATAILNRTLDELQLPENASKLEEARDKVGNEMLKMMRFVFPVVMEVQMNVIRQFGYPDGLEGITKFADMLRSLERENEEVARLHAMVKAYFMPPVGVNASNESGGDDKSNST